MDSREKTELENLALAAELSRQLCHDFNNFLYNLFLQIEIAKTTSVAANADDWDAVKRAGDKATRRLRDWDRFHRRFTLEEAIVDLHQLIRQVAAAASSERMRVEPGPSIAGEPLCIGTAATDSRHLLRLLIEDEFEAWREAAESVPVVLIDATKDKLTACVRIVAQSPSIGETDESSGDVETLLAAACQSLAVRLGATIRRDRLPGNRPVIEVVFPSSLLNGAT
jgi:hypothetical protein